MTSKRKILLVVKIHLEAIHSAVVKVLQALKASQNNLEKLKAVKDSLSETFLMGSKVCLEGKAVAVKKFKPKDKT